MEEPWWGWEGVAHVFQRCYCVWIVLVTPFVLVLLGVVTFLNISSRPFGPPNTQTRATRPEGWVLVVDRGVGE